MELGRQPIHRVPDTPPCLPGTGGTGYGLLFFKAADPTSLAESVTRLCYEPGLYAHLSTEAAVAHEALYVGMEWQDLVNVFLEDPTNQTGWVEHHSQSA